MKRKPERNSQVHPIFRGLVNAMCPIGRVKDDEEPAGAGYPDLGAESETERNERINGYRRMK